MKKLILSATVAFTVLTTSNIYAQQGFGTNTPDRSSAVEIVSGKRGLLIPRLDIPNLDQGTPVINPANALMVYNIGSKTPAGFYYWDANFKHEGGSKGRWVRFVSSNSGSSVTVSAGDNVTVTPKPDVNGHDIDYNVSVKAGTAPNQVLVTKEVTVEGKTTYVSEWVNPEVFLKDVVAGTNGVKTEVITDDKGNTKTVVKLGGDLTEKTILNTGAGKELAITGLDTLTKGNVAGHNIVVMGADGILKNVSAKDLMEDAIDKGAIDGKALTSKGNSIQIEGAAADTALLKNVNIEVKGGEKAGQVLVTKEVKDGEGKVTYVTEWVDASALGNTVKSGQGITVKSDNTVNLGGEITELTKLDLTGNGSLAIIGLDAPADKNTVLENVKIGADGKLYAVNKSESTGSITITKEGDINIAGDTNYSINQEEVVIEVTLGATDTNLKLPTPSGVEGQTISVKIANTNENHNGYLNIVQENDTVSNRLAYGAMPFQGWIIKSNGTKWIVVGRN